MLHVDESIIDVVHGKGESRVKLARRGATWDALLGTIGTIMGLMSAGDGDLHLQVIGGRYLQAGRGFPDTAGHEGF